MNVKRIEWVFSQLHGAHGNALFEKFRSGELVNGQDTGIANMKQVWDKAIESKGLTAEEVMRGVTVCMQTKFPPSLPEFLEASRPAVDALRAYYEALEGMKARASGKTGTWSHPAIFWAASRMGHELRSQGYSAIKGQWERTLQVELDKGQWDPVPEPVQAIGHERKADPEKAQNAVDQARQATSGNKVNHHAWWQKILTKAKDRPASVSPFQLGQALQAQRNAGMAS